MKKFLLLLMTAFMFTFTFTSCDSDEDDAPVVPVAQTKTQMLTGKKWIVTAETTTETDSAGTVTTDTFATMDPCEKDNTLLFATNGTATFDEGANLCPGEAQTSSGTWAFTNNETQILLTSGGFGIPGEVIELSATKLIIKITFSFGGNSSVTTTTFGVQP